MRSLIEAGSVVQTLNGSMYRVVSKTATGEGRTFRLADLQGQPVATPKNFQPVSPALAKVAAWFRFVFAYNKDFDLYVKEYIRAAGLPVDEKIHWDRWFQYAYPPKLSGLTQDPDVIDEAIHQVIITALAKRRDLTKFDASRLPEGARKQPLAEQVTTYLQWLFKKRISEAYEFIKEKIFPPEETSMYQDNPEGAQSEGEEYNVLDTEEHATPGGQAGIEEQTDLARLRDGFASWLKEKETPNEITKLLVCYDFFVQNTGRTLKISDYAPYFKEQTDLGFDSLKPVYAKFKRYIPEFLVEAGMISKEKAMARGMGATSSLKPRLASLNIAAAESAIVAGPTSDEQIIPNQTAEAGPATTELNENSHPENGPAGSPVLDGDLKSPERPNVNAVREALDAQAEMEVGKPIVEKEKELEAEENAPIEVESGKGKQIIINIAAGPICECGHGKTYHDSKGKQCHGSKDCPCNGNFRKAKSAGEEDAVERTGDKEHDFNPKAAGNPPTYDALEADDLRRSLLRKAENLYEQSSTEPKQRFSYLPPSERKMWVDKAKMESLKLAAPWDNDIKNPGQPGCSLSAEEFYDLPTLREIWGDYMGIPKPKHKRHMGAEKPVCPKCGYDKIDTTKRHGPEERGECGCKYGLEKTAAEYPGISMAYCPKCKKETRHAVAELASGKGKQCMDCHYEEKLAADDTGRMPHNPEAGSGRTGPADPIVVDTKLGAAVPGDRYCDDCDKHRWTESVGGRKLCKYCAQAARERKSAASAPRPAGPQVKQYGTPAAEKGRPDVDVIPGQEENSGSGYQEQPRRKTIMPELPNAEMILQLNAAVDKTAKINKDIWKRLQDAFPGDGDLAFSPKYQEYIVKHGYFYSHGYDEDKLAAKVKKVIPEAQVTKATNHWNAWPKDSWFEVRFKVPEAVAPIAPAPAPATSEPKVEEPPMATPATASVTPEKRAALREKIAARRKERAEAKNVKYARLQQVAADEPEAADEGLMQLGDAFGQLAEDVEALRENLDLVEAPAEAPLEERIASRRAYAKKFREIATENPEQLEMALAEVYQSLDEVAQAVENYADHMGLDVTLTGEGKEEVPPQTPNAEKMEEIEGEYPTPGDIPAEKLEEEPKEAAVGADAFSSDRDHDGKPKEATSGSDNFVTDRDEKGDAKMPQRVEVPRLAARAAQIIAEAKKVVASFKK
jgi:hypothetical protein